MKNDGLLPAAWKAPAAVLFSLSVLSAAFWLAVGAPEGGIKWLSWRIPALWSHEFLSSTAAGSHWVVNNLTDELLLVVITLSGLVLGFSRERVEDELIRQLRWKALAHATWINALLFLAATLTVYGATYLYVMYAQLVAFLVLFNVLLAWSLRTHYASGHEE